MTKTTLLTATLDVQAARGNDAIEGWSPWTRFYLQGPTPSGAQVGVEFRHQDGVEWFSLWSELNETAAGELVRVDLWSADESAHTKSVGNFSFLIRLVSELDCVDESLLQGVLSVEARADLYVVRQDWRLPVGSLGFDSGDRDAPHLVATWWLPGEVDALQSAYLFYKGQRILSTENREHGYLETCRKIFASDNVTVLYNEMQVTLPVVKAYLNTEYVDMDRWHVLSQNIGDYEIRVTLNRTPVRALCFHVGESGRLEKTGPLALNHSGVPLMQVNAMAIEKGAGVPDNQALAQHSYFGNSLDLEDQSIDVWYAWQQMAVENDTVTDPELAVSFGDAEKLYDWYYEEMTTGLTAGGDPVDLEQCRMALERVESILSKFAALDAKASAKFSGATRTVAEARTWMQAIQTGAQRALSINEQTQTAALAPYRAVLKNDKLRIFEEHPANEYLCYTSRKKKIETPSEMAQAVWWYFEGSEDQGYITQKWTVRGWRFDEEHNLVGTVDESGHGIHAPSAAFK